MKTIAITIQETNVFQFQVEVPDDFPDDWSGTQPADDQLRDRIFDLWSENGSMANDYVETVEDVVVGWKTVQEGR